MYVSDVITHRTHSEAPKRSTMASRAVISRIHTVAAASGASAVGAGAYGAHAYKPTEAKFKEVYDTANRYHLVHSLLIAVAPLTRRPMLVASLATAGVAAFSGSCYAVALSEHRPYGALAPVGGFALIGAWAALALP